MPTEPVRDLDVRLAKALSHPLRRRLLMAYNDQPASPSELAAALGEPLGDVSYHTKRLVEHGCLELVRTEQRRGRVRRVYRATVPYELEDEQWRALPEVARRSALGQVLRILWGEVGGSVESGRLFGDDVHVSRFRLELDGEAWNDVSRLLRQAVEDVRRIADESDRRQAAERRGAVVAMLHFEP